MKISKRLKTISQMIPSRDTVIDVGCDHGLLGIYLILNKKCSHVINTDISENAIKKAKENAKTYHLEQSISFLVTDGLKAVPYKKEDVLVLTGMGTHTMLKILKDFKKVETLILSTQKDIPYLRKEMVKMGYKITEEQAIFDKKWYVIIRFDIGKANYTKEDYLLGPFARQNEKYIKYKKEKEENISKKKKQKTEMLLLLEKQKT